MKRVDFFIEGKRYEFDWLNMADFMGLYSKKHNLDNITDANGEDKAREYLYSFVDDEYSEIPEKYRMMVLISLILSSEGNNEVVLTNECKDCHDEHHITMRLNEMKSSEDFTFFDIDGNEIVITFGSLSYRNRENPITELYENITMVKINGTYIKWNILSEKTKESILSYVSEDTVKKLLEELYPCSMKFINAHGCKNIQVMNGVVENDDLSIFNYLINKSDVGMIYKIATIMAGNGINITDYMGMAPFERKEILKNIQANNEMAGKEK